MMIQYTMCHYLRTHDVEYIYCCLPTEVDDSCIVKHACHVKFVVPNMFRSQPPGDAIIELPKEVFPGCKLPSEVEACVCTRLVDAKDAYMEPCTEDDWQLLESFASALESGKLLQQISVVYPNQILPLAVYPGLVAHVKVLPSSFEHPKTIWDDADDLRAAPCVRLLAQNNVIVTPKPRSRTVYPYLRLVPCLEEYGEVASRLTDILRCPPVSAPLCTVLIHPRVLETMIAAGTHRDHIVTVHSFQKKDNLTEAVAIARAVPCDVLAEDTIGKKPAFLASFCCWAEHLGRTLHANSDVMKSITSN